MDQGSGFDIVIVNTHLSLPRIPFGFLSLGFRWLGTCVSSVFVPLQPPPFFIPKGIRNVLTIILLDSVILIFVWVSRYTRGPKSLGYSPHPMGSSSPEG